VALADDARLRLIVETDAGCDPDDARLVFTGAER
jgi:hypothetical protein